MNWVFGLLMVSSLGNLFLGFKSRQPLASGLIVVLVVLIGQSFDPPSDSASFRHPADMLLIPCGFVLLLLNIWVFSVAASKKTGSGKRRQDVPVSDDWLRLPTYALVLGMGAVVVDMTVLRFPLCTFGFLVFWFAGLLVATHSLFGGRRKQALQWFVTSVVGLSVSYACS